VVEFPGDPVGSHSVPPGTVRLYHYTSTNPATIVSDEVVVVADGWSERACRQEREAEPWLECVRRELAARKEHG